MPDFPKLTLVTGGAASGKSRFAERLVLSSVRTPVYVATAQAFDTEMDAKIAKHRGERGGNWRLIEEPIDIVTALKGQFKDEIVLVDCLTMWLSNLLLANKDPSEFTAPLLEQLANMKTPIVLVTNEVGSSVVPENASARQFQRVQGTLNQRVAEKSDLVVTVIAGLPLSLKGRIPDGVS